jgi:hypothetical protein
MVSFLCNDYLGSLLGEFQLMDESERTRIFEEACPFIERKLADMRYLKEFSWQGKQAFYNDDTGNADSTASLDHLKDSFKVSTNGINFFIWNDREVHSSKGSYNLFELLWKGFGAYRVPRTSTKLSNEQIAYYMRTKKMTRELTKFGGLWNQPAGNTMTFYNRYWGKWYYKMQERKGMSEGLVTKFHSYIEGAIEVGVQESMKSLVSADSYELMGGE